MQIAHILTFYDLQMQGGECAVSQKMFASSPLMRLYIVENKILKIGVEEDYEMFFMSVLIMFS